MADEDMGPWHLDKRVPVALILTIVLQTGGVIWWASQQTHRLGAVEAAAVLVTANARENEIRIRTLELSRAQTDERLINIVGTLARIERKLEVVIE